VGAFRVHEQHSEGSIHAAPHGGTLPYLLSFNLANYPCQSTSPLIPHHRTHHGMKVPYGHAVYVIDAHARGRAVSVVTCPCRVSRMFD